MKVINVFFFRLSCKIRRWSDIAYSKIYSFYITNGGRLSVSRPVFINNTSTISFGRGCNVGRFTRIESFGFDNTVPQDLPSGRLLSDAKFG